jgi:hypothetical protein
MTAKGIEVFADRFQVEAGRPQLGKHTIGRLRAGRDGCPGDGRSEADAQ